MTDSSNESKGNLLVVSYNFPPIVSAGVYRVTGFAGRLRRKGWLTTVLTVTKSAYETTDESSFELVDPELRVVRASPLDPPWTFSSGASSPGTSPGPLRWFGRKAVSALRLLHKRLFGFPEPKATWGLPLMWRAWRILRNGRYIVLSSSPPHSSQFALAVLKRLVDFKWVADFRDPWTAPDRHHRGNLSFKIERRMEEKVLRSCDRILANTAGNKRALLETYKFLSDDKVDVVTNGFDDSVGRSQPRLDSSVAEFDMLYFGEMYPGMLNLLLDALDALVRKDSPFIPRIGVHGWITEKDLEEIRRRGYEKQIEFRGALSYTESIEAMAQARSLLLLLWHDRDHAMCVPSKLYPYLAAGPTVVAIAPSGDATEILERTGAGVAITETDPERVAASLEDVVSAIRSGAPRMERREDIIQEYSLDSLVARIDAILTDEVSAW